MNSEKKGTDEETIKDIRDGSRDNKYECGVNHARRELLTSEALSQKSSEIASLEAHLSVAHNFIKRLEPFVSFARIQNQDGTLHDIRTEIDDFWKDNPSHLLRYEAERRVIEAADAWANRDSDADGEKDEQKLYSAIEALKALEDNL